MKRYTAADGTQWGVDVVLPGSSNAMVVFRHPDGDSSRLDRYNWYISSGPEARSVTSRLAPKRVLEEIDEPTIDRLFRRSMPVSRPAIEPNLALGLGGAAAGQSAGMGRVDHQDGEAQDSLPEAHNDSS
jgi:hypothetical protein